MAAPAAGDRPVKPDGSSSYILLVQHLIEKCLLFNMNQRECVEALSKHANIEPVISITVWNELEKENKDFFSSYFQNMQKNRKEEDYCSQAPPEQIMLEDAAGQVHHQRLDQDYSSNCRQPILR